MTSIDMRHESHVTVLTSFTVLANIARPAGARVREIWKIFHTFSSVFAVVIAVALEFCMIHIPVLLY